MFFQQNNQPNQSRKEDGKIATLICSILTIITILTIVLGLWLKNPYIIIAGILPAALYEAWRTEGFFTKFASVGIAILAILEILAILNIFRANLAQTMESETFWVYGYSIPLGDIRFVFPAACVVLSIILIIYTYGKYTKWLSVLLLASSVALIWLVNRGGLVEIIKHFQYFY